VLDLRDRRLVADVPEQREAEQQRQLRDGDADGEPRRFVRRDDWGSRAIAGGVGVFSGQPPELRHLPSLFPRLDLADGPPAASRWVQADVAEMERLGKDARLAAETPTPGSP